MTEVLSIAPPPDAGFASGPLRRSASQTSFFLPSHIYVSSGIRSADYATPHDTHDYKPYASVPSSAPSSPCLAPPEFSNQPSYLSTPSSSLSLDEHYSSDDDDDESGDDSEDDHVQFPSYDGTPKQDFCPTTELEKLGCADNIAEATEPSTKPPRPPSKIDSTTCFLQLIGDDTAAKRQPSRHVDYLSHDWKEEDIWASWRHVTGKRILLENWERLENASWRTWAKSQNRLKTVSPEKLNWMKDHDVTWLYGPLQTGKVPLGSEPGIDKELLSRSDSFFGKKPILKKRSISEVMLQRSISSSTLMKQAVDALRAQEPDSRQQRPIMAGRTYSDFVISSPISSSSRTVPQSPSPLLSPSSSDVETPAERRRIHFNDEVEQCIAINKEGDEHDDHDEDSIAIREDDESSDDGIIMMKSERGKERKLSSRSVTPRGSFSNESKTIAMLPSTTLKYRGDTPEPAKQEAKQKGSVWSTSNLAKSSSQETLRPTRSSSNFLIDDEDEEEADVGWKPSETARRDSVYRQGPFQGYTQEDAEMETRGLRRTPSGMFMPYEEDEDDVVAAGLFGKVVDTVNTAKDIAHVIWNVGWRR